LIGANNRGFTAEVAEFYAENRREILNIRVSEWLLLYKPQ
jgi:hypothetical protein